MGIIIAILTADCMRTLFIHCGLHKTGSSALQQALFTNRRLLLEQGVMYPEVGIPPGACAHYNLAWQLSRDRRFQRHLGELNAVLRGLDGAHHSAILSCEDFESSLLHPRRWQAIRDQLDASAWQVVVVVYQRDPREYLESLYCQLLQSELGQEFALFASQAVRERRLVYREWEFVFDAAQIARAMQQVDGVEVILRDYHALTAGSVIDDFCEVVGLNPEGFVLPPGLVNPRPALADLLRHFYKNRMGGSSVDASEAIAALCERSTGPLASPRNIATACEGLMDARPGQRRSPLARRSAPDALDIGKVFSFETCLMISDLRAMGRTQAAARLIAGWQQWTRLGTAGE